MKKIFFVLLLFIVPFSFIFADEVDDSSEHINENILNFNDKTDDSVIKELDDYEKNYEIEYNYEEIKEENIENYSVNVVDNIDVQLYNSELSNNNELKNSSKLQYIDGYYYYINEGEKLKGIVRDENDNLYYFDQDTGKMQTGWINYEGKTYYADLETGVLKRLVQEIDGKSYFFGRTTAALQKGVISFYEDIYLTDDDGALQSGIQNVDDRAYLFGDDYKAKSGWIEYNGYKYYADINSKQLYNLIHEVDGELYFFEKNKYCILTGWINYEGKTYYADLETGVLKRLVQEIDGKSYFFGRTTAALQKGVISFYEDIYLTDDNGALQSGIQNIDNRTYLFGDDYKAKSGWIEYNGYKYYADINSKQLYNLIHEVDGELYFFGRTQYRALTGWINYEGKTYYADLETGKLKRLIHKVDGENYFFGRTTAALQKGLIEYYGDYYYSNSCGILQQGLVILDNKSYIFDEDNKAKTGWIDYNGNKYYANLNNKQLYNLIHEVDGELYFFGRTQYRALTGWINYEGKTYYADLETGKLKRLIHKVDGENYFFGRTTAALQKGLIEYYGDYYYSNSCGILQQGLVILDDKSYIFDEDNKAKTGWIDYNGNKYYADLNNKQLYNLIHVIDGKAYFFGRTQYRVLKGWITYNGSTYYADLDTGELAVGSKSINGVVYYFDNGYKLQSGWKVINGSTYYLYSDLTKAVGLKTIDGKRYMFNANGVLMYSNVKVYIDISSHQGDINFEQLWCSGQIDGIILRAGYWNSEDRYFKYYIEEVKRLGIPYTVYLFSYAHDGNEALIEAKNMVEILKKYNLSPSLNVYYDLEGYKTVSQTSDDISIVEYQNIAQTFINYLSQNGYSARIYSYYYFALNRFNDMTRSQLDWIAKYTDTNNYPYNWRGWQFTDAGSLPGINGNVDMSIFLY